MPSSTELGPVRVMNGIPSLLPAPSTASKQFHRYWEKAVGARKTSTSQVFAGTDRRVAIRYLPVGRKTNSSSNGSDIGQKPFEC